MSLGASIAAGLAAGGASGLLNGAFGLAGQRYGALQNWKFYKKQRALDYQYDSGEYYNLSRRYAENSAKWQAQGLRNAGINPMLAAINGNIGTFGPGSSSSASFGGSGSPITPFGDFSASLEHSAKASQVRKSTDLQVQGLAKDNDIKDATKQQIDAQTANIEANTAATKIRALNEERNAGMSGNAAVLYRFGNDTAKNISVLSNPRSRSLRDFRDLLISAHTAPIGGIGIGYGVRRLAERARTALGSMFNSRGVSVPASAPVNTGKDSARWRHETNGYNDNKPRRRHN